MNEIKAINIADLNFYYDDLLVLDDINLSVNEKDFLGIIGPNGGGKTTLIKLITGLLKPSGGTIEIYGKPPSKLSNEIGYVPQRSDFDKHYPVSVFDVVLMGRVFNKSFFGKYKDEDESTAEESLDKVSMLNFKNELIGNLSGGQIQRVLIARALAVKPKILLLDEPTASVDSKIGKSFYELLEELNKEITILLISHDIGVVSRYVKKIACLNKKLVTHNSKEITKEMLEETYHCPVDLIAHGVPHRVLNNHNKEKI